MKERDSSPSWLLKVPGNSGFRTELISSPGLVVRKTALTPDGADRLRRQRMKQQAFRTPDPRIRAPKVLAFDASSFQMEYLSMLDSIEFLERASPAIILQRLQILFDFVRWECESSQTTEVSAGVLRDKLTSIRNMVPAPVWQRYYADRAHNFEESLPESIRIPIGTCHGDLTLSNVMFSIEEDSIGLLDFLDSFIDSPLVDLAKLRQDTRFNWTSYRYLRSHDTGKIRLVNSWIDRLLCEMFADHIETLGYLALESINFFRIAPYMQEERDHCYLAEVLSQIRATQEAKKCV